MSNYCKSCGVSIPNGQSVCSMCYGDVDYGRDGYYRRWAEAQQKRQEEDKAYDEILEEMIQEEIQKEQSNEGGEK